MAPNYQKLELIKRLHWERMVGIRKPRKSRKQRRAERAERDRLERAKKEMPYSEYLKTPHWRKVRARKIEQSNRMCDRCGEKKRLEVHHKHYRTLWKEKMGDLETVCKWCHGTIHECLVAADSHLKAIVGLGLKFEVPRRER